MDRSKYTPYVKPKLVLVFELSLLMFSIIISLTSLSFCFIIYEKSNKIVSDNNIKYDTLLKNLKTEYSEKLQAKNMLIQPLYNYINETKYIETNETNFSSITFYNNNISITKIQNEISKSDLTFVNSIEIFVNTIEIDGNFSLPKNRTGLQGIDLVIIASKWEFTNYNIYINLSGLNGDDNTLGGDGGNFIGIGLDNLNVNFSIYTNGGNGGNGLKGRNGLDGKYGKSPSINILSCKSSTIYKNIQNDSYELIKVFDPINCGQDGENGKEGKPPGYNGQVFFPNANFFLENKMGKMGESGKGGKGGKGSMLGCFLIIHKVKHTKVLSYPICNDTKAPNGRDGLSPKIKTITLTNKTNFNPIKYLSKFVKLYNLKNETFLYKVFSNIEKYDSFELIEKDFYSTNEDLLYKILLFRLDNLNLTINQQYLKNALKSKLEERDLDVSIFHLKVPYLKVVDENDGFLKPWKMYFGSKEVYLTDEENIIFLKSGLFKISIQVRLFKLSFKCKHLFKHIFIFYRCTISTIQAMNNQHHIQSE